MGAAATPDICVWGGFPSVFEWVFEWIGGGTNEGAQPATLAARAEDSLTVVLHGEGAWGPGLAPGVRCACDECAPPSELGGSEGVGAIAQRRRT